MNKQVTFIAQVFISLIFILSVLSHTASLSQASNEIDHVSFTENSVWCDDVQIDLNQSDKASLSKLYNNHTSSNASICDKAISLGETNF